MSMRSPLLLAATSLLAACWSHRLDRNAPGHVDLAPPADLATREPDRPRDPGDQVLILAGGPSIAGGLAFGGGRAERGAWSLSLEAGARYGRFARTALYDAPAAPDAALGAGFGWVPLGERGQRPRLFAELQGTRRFIDFASSGLGLGWTWETTGRAGGPQATACLGPLFLRGWHLPGAGTTLEVGISLQPTFSLLWSR